MNEIESNQAMYKAAGHDPTRTIGSVTHTKSDLNQNYCPLDSLEDENFKKSVKILSESVTNLKKM